MFDLNSASEKLTTSYQKPGIANVEITGVLLEETTTNHVPFIRITTRSESGDLGTTGRMFLSTEIKPGNKTSGWAVTARNLVDIITASRNVDEPEAKNMIKVETKEQLVAKLSAILVGQKMRAKFKGEISEKGTTFAILSQVESLSVDAANSSLRFDPARDIKPANNNVTTTTTAEAANTTDLPF